MKLSCIVEGFGTPKDLLSDPANDHLTWWKLVDKFEADGGQLLGQGRYGQVLYHPDWPYVIKLFPQDDIYLKFIRFAYSNPHVSFPKIYGPPKSVVPRWTRTLRWSKVYVARIERLYEPKDWDDHRRTVNFLDKYIDIIFQKLSGKSTISDVDSMSETLALVERRLKDPNIRNVAEGLYLLKQNNIPGVLDLHENNLMYRANGQLVLIDPLWEGSTPYAQERANREMYNDSYYYDEPELVKGGQLKRRKRIRKRRVPAAVSKAYDDSPF
jgi:hypothetical protein